MTKNYLEKTKHFTEKSLPNLLDITIASLELFMLKKSSLSLPHFKKPLVIGSGNAIATAKILFSEVPAIFADETSFKKALSFEYDGVVILSASGSKHAPIIAKAALKKGKPVFGITCTFNSELEHVLGSKHVLVTPKNREPYTYNTSTYMGWIFSKTKESPSSIRSFILRDVLLAIKKQKVDLSKYTGFLLVTPDRLSLINHLFEVKFIELFGRRVARDVKSIEELKHAITVVPSKKELCIVFGDVDEKELFFENDILKIPLPKGCNFAAMMAIGYAVIGKIQESKPAFFKKYIHSYIEKHKKHSFGKSLGVIVE